GRARRRGGRCARRPAARAAPRAPRAVHTRGRGRTVSGDRRRREAPVTGTTASSGGPSLALCVICHERPDELRAALASAPGFDEVVVLDMASEPPLAPEPGVTWLREERNAGVAAGRNRQAAAATADVLVFLDDDAVFASPDPAAAIRAVLREHPDVAGLAFRIVRADGQTMK